MTTIKLKDKDYWATPPAVFRNIEKKLDLKFDLDACATEYNRKCADYISEEQNTLITPWGSGRNVYMNPPYSKPLPFVEKAIDEAYLHNNNVVVLLNADTSTKWFTKIKEYASEIWFITEGRIAFLDYRTGKNAKGNNRPQLFAVFHAKGNSKWNAKPKTHYITRKELQQ